MNEYLYVLKPTRLEMLVENTPEEAAIVTRHFLRLQDQTEKGVVLLAGRTLNTDASTFGIVIFRAESDEVARQFMDDDPAIQHGVMVGQLFPYRVALLSDTYPRAT
jgi:uncharacterized protein YciI